MMAERPNYLDYAKVITVYLVILGHYVSFLSLDFQEGPLWTLEHSITLFHMPLFFFVSGMLYRENSTKDEIRKGWRQLLKPYLYMTLSCLCIGLIFLTSHDDLTPKFIAKQVIGIFSASDFFGKGIDVSSGPLWFCMALFIIKIIMAYTRSTSVRKVTCNRLIICVLGGGILYLGNILPFRIDSALVGFIFFFIGYSTKKHISLLIQQNLICKFGIIALSALVLFFIAKINLDVTQRQVLSIYVLKFGPHPFLFIFSGIVGTILIITLCSFFERFKSRLVLQLSNGSIIVLGFQMIIIRCFRGWLQSYNVLVAIVFSLFVLFVCYLLILLSNKYFPSLLGGRKLN